ncbi:MAG TPA: uroporphyrinogen-III synthase [Alphaproteobacteria bacterium]|nr:uroporphyrinogen-III synthase [Alphaproteobacteria bacterium]
MRVLITRPREEAQALAALLAARGIDTLIDPLLEIKSAPPAALPLEGVQALLFTSANGLRAFAERQATRTLPVYAVGARTAELARSLGFTTVESADGAAADLARLVQARLDPRGGTLLHCAGAVVKDELAALLLAAGFAVRRTVLYEAIPAAALLPATERALATGALAAVLFFSPRTAATFVSLARAAGLDSACAHLSAVCLSPAVAEEAGALAWRRRLTAARPEQSALLELVSAEQIGDRVAERAGAEPEETGESQVRRAIRAFGGVRPMATRLGVPATTVQGWKERGHIPAARVADVLAAAATHGVPLTAADLAAAAAEPPAPRPASAAEARAAAQPIPSVAAPAPSAPRVAAEVQPGAGSPRERGPVLALWAIALAALVLAAAMTLPLWAPLLGLAQKPAAAPPAAAGDATLVRELGSLATSLGAIEARLGNLETQTKSAVASPPAKVPAAAAPAAPSAPLAEELAASERRVTALERTVAELASRPPPPTADAAGAAADTAAELASLTKRVAELEHDNGALAEERKATEQRLAALEAELKRIAAVDVRRAALVLAISQLREALARSQPYDKALAELTAFAAGDGELEAAVAALKPTAATGVATVGELAERFDGAALAAARAAIVSRRPGWIGETLTRLQRLVVVRHTGALAGNGTDAVLARAEVELKAGQLAAATAVLDGLDGPAAEAMRPWLASAKARLAADAALAALSARATARLGEGPS